MRRASSTGTGVPPLPWTRFCRAPSPPTCPWSSRCSASCSSTSRPRRPSGSRYRRCSSSGRTKCSNRRAGHTGGRRGGWRVERCLHERWWGWRRERGETCARRRGPVGGRRALWERGGDSNGGPAFPPLNFALEPTAPSGRGCRYGCWCLGAAAHRGRSATLY